MVTVVAMVMTTRRATMFAPVRLKNHTVMLSMVWVWAVMVPVLMVTIVMVTG